MNIKAERNEDFGKKSWINDMVMDVKLAKDLTSIYADDVIQAVDEKSFGTLDDAIAALKAEVGLTTADVNDIKMVVLAKTEPAVYIAKQNILKLSKADLGEVLKLSTTVCEKCSEAPCTCSETISSVTARAINSIGLEVLADLYDAMPDEKGLKGKHTERADDAGLKGDIDSKESKEVTAKGMNPGFRAYLDKKKKEKEGKSTEPEAETDKKEDEKEAEASLKSKAEVWAEFLSKKGYFLGADEKSFEGKVTSNDPEELGYGTAEGVHYGKDELETEKGPVREQEQKAFEGAADATKKEFLPNGTDLELKKKWQRAKYMGVVNRVKLGKI